MKTLKELFLEAIQSKAAVYKFSLSMDNKDVVDECDDHHKLGNYLIADITSKEIAGKRNREVLSVYQSYLNTLPQPLATSCLDPFGMWIDNVPFQLGFLYSVVNSFVNEHDLKMFIENYGRGFLEGYESFEHDLSIKLSPMFSSNEDKVSLLFDFATNHWRGIRSPAIGGDGLDEGNYFGKLYKAWSIILRNQGHFKLHAVNYLRSMRDFTSSQRSLKLKYKDVKTSYRTLEKLFKKDGAYRRFCNRMVDKKVVDGNGRYIRKVSDSVSDRQFVFGIGACLEQENNLLNEVVDKKELAFVMNDYFGFDYAENKYYEVYNLVVNASEYEKRRNDYTPKERNDLDNQHSKGLTILKHLSYLGLENL